MTPYLLSVYQPDGPTPPPEVMGLLALMLLVESRRPARTTPDGGLVRLADQDRGRWNRDLIAEGQTIVRACPHRQRRRTRLPPPRPRVHSPALIAAPAAVPSCLRERLSPAALALQSAFADSACVSWLA